MLVVYTAALGDTDLIQPPAVVDPSARYLAFSDREPPTPYEWVPCLTDEDPRLASRQVKVLADHPLLARAAVTLWHDASYALTEDLSWVRPSLSQGGGFDLLALPHHKHDVLEEEAAAIVRRGFVSPGRAWRLVDRYRQEGYTQTGVTAGGLLVRAASPAMTRFQQVWWREVRRWHGRDQASLDYAAWQTGLRVGYVAGWMRDNPYAVWLRDEEAVA